MMRVTACAVLLLAICALLLGCARSEERASESPEPEQVSEEVAEVARTRGVREEGYQSEEDTGTPQVVLSEVVYEWRTVPETGLLVSLTFTNPAETYERARGYVFLVAESTLYGSPVTGVYPWNTRLGDDGLPEDYTDGTHLLYRTEQLVRGVIPYPRSDGYYNILKLFVFSEDGGLITNRQYDLEITGEPGEATIVNPGFDL